MAEQRKKSKRNLALLASVLAMGMFGASIAGGQMLSAQAQQLKPDDPIPVDVGCPTGSEICGNQIADAVTSTVATSGSASTKVDPDMVSVTVGVETQGSTAEEAAKKNADLMNQVIGALKEIGVSDDEISTSWYNVYPTYEYRSPPCVDIYPQPPDCSPSSQITGYRASNSLTVTVSADEDAGKLIDAAVGAGANNVSGAYFFVSEGRQQEIRDGLIQKAIDNAKSRAEKAADAVDMKVTGVKSVNLNDVYFPVFYRDAAPQSAGSTTPIMPGQQQVSMTVQVVFEMG